ncbi:MAG: GGDEF domain-containing protein [Oscillospiraceae bacterium]|nr:GGDEF domain-containing protein [Oscillospiraceae bacterium]
MKASEEFLQELGRGGAETLELISEMAEMVAYYRRMLERLELDSLTGLPGSNKFREFTAGIESFAESVGVIFFDVNGLKECNDTKGHHAGDLLLQKAAESFHALTDENIRAFRIGGDEFVVVITNREAIVVEQTLAKWREILSELNAANDGIYCSVAAGAAFGSGEYEIGSILKLADERMYAEKISMKGAET